MAKTARKSPRRRRRPAAPRAAARKTARRKPRRPARPKARAKAPKKKASKKTLKALKNLKKKNLKKKSAAPARRKAARRPAARRPPAPGRAPRKTLPPAIERERRRLPDADLASPEFDMRDDRLLASARAGHDELRALLGRHTETSPVMTAGDIDARWQEAYAVGDEAPGGDNPTPDQDRVDDIGKALGVQYRDDEELRGAEKIADRDRHRWELDPASSDDWPHEK